MGWGPGNQTTIKAFERETKKKLSSCGMFISSLDVFPREYLSPTNVHWKNSDPMARHYFSHEYGVNLDLDTSLLAFLYTIQTFFFFSRSQKNGQKLSALTTSWKHDFRQQSAISDTLYRVAKKNPGTVDFLGLCSDQQLFFFTLLDRHLFLIIITPRSYHFSLRTFYFMSNFLWTVVFGICH